MPSQPPRASPKVNGYFHNRSNVLKVVHPHAADLFVGPVPEEFLRLASNAYASVSFLF